MPSSIEKILIVHFQEYGRTLICDNDSVCVYGIVVDFVCTATTQKH